MRIPVDYPPAPLRTTTNESTFAKGRAAAYSDSFMSEPANNTPEGSEGKPAANLYSKSERSPKNERSARTRLLDAPSKKKLITVEIGGAQRRRKSSRPGPFQHILKANLKRLTTVGALMLLLIFAAFQLVRLFGKQEDSKTKPGPANATATSNPPSGPILFPKSDSNTTFAPAPIRTEDFRKAAYLARKAKTYEDAGDLEKAVQNYREALEVWPNSPTVWAQLGRVMLRQKDFWHAQISLEKAADIGGGAADLLNDLGVAYLWQEGKLDRAMKMFDTATDVDPNYAPTYFNKALGYLARNDAPKAREALEQYLRMKPDDPRGLREIACMKARAGKYADALSDIQKAVAQAPDWPLLYFDSAAINALQGQCDTAIRYLEKALPLSDPATVFQVWQEPAFRECRISEIGKVFEKDIADRARDGIKEKEGTTSPSVSEPIVSSPK